MGTRLPVSSKRVAATLAGQLLGRRAIVPAELNVLYCMGATVEARGTSWEADAFRMILEF
jgi:hypothetical protein